MPTPFEPSLKLNLRRHLPIGAMAVGGLCLSVVLFLTIRNWEHRVNQTAVESAGAQRVELLRQSLGNSLEVLHSLGSFYGLGRAISREQFARFVSEALARRPELQALSWTPRVSAADREHFEKTARSEGFADFQFTEHNPASGRMVRARDRSDYYYPVFFIEPLQRNQPALGYDLNARLDTLARARDTGEATATPPSELIQEQQHEPGFIVYLPIFAGPAPATIAERRLVNTGFVAAVFRIADLVGPALARQPGLRVTLRDATAAAAPVVYSVPAADAAPAEERLSACDFSLPFAGREWRITFTPTTGFVAGGPVWQSWAALVVGVALTALLTGYLLASSRRATEIAQANAALQAEVVERQRAEATAAAASQAKSEFVASLSHEIRTPLNSILGYTQILERDASLSLHQGEAVRALANSGQHLLGLLNSILDFSKIEAGRMELQCDAFSPAALVQGVAEMFKLSCWEKRLTLRVDCPEDGPPHVLGDEGKLRQVLINLLGNAIKFTPQGEVCVSARLGSGGQWRFEIVDTGIGMTAEECAGLFAPFHQTVVGRRHGGTGLGLAIARGHIELMGGNIAVQSESGRGSRFSFYLPLLTAEVAKRTAAGGVFWPQPVLSPSCVTPSVATSALLSSTEFEDIVLPEDLCARMSEAAELHSTTVVKACLEELRQLGGPAVPLADHLRHLLRTYDLAAITRVVDRLRLPPRRAA